MLTCDTIILLRHIKLFKYPYFEHNNKLLRPIKFLNTKLNRIDSLLYLAAREGNLDLVIWLYNGSNIHNKIINHGSLNILKSIGRLLQYNKDAIIIAVKEGKLNILKFMVHIIDIEEVARIAVYCKQLEILEWCNNQSMRYYITKIGDLETIIWYNKYHTYDITDMVNLITEYGRFGEFRYKIPALDWMNTTYPEFLTDYNLIDIIEDLSEYAVKWVYANHRKLFTKQVRKRIEDICTKEWANQQIYNICHT